MATNATGQPRPQVGRGVKYKMITLSLGFWIAPTLLDNEIRLVPKKLLQTT